MISFFSLLLIFELGKLRSARLALFEHRGQRVQDLVGVGHIALIKGEMILEQSLAETRMPMSFA